MSITVDVDEAILREAEGATNIHDPATLVRTGLILLARTNGAPETAVAKPFDFERTLAAAEALGDLSDAEFDAFEREMNRPLPPAWTE